MKREKNELKRGEGSSRIKKRIYHNLEQLVIKT